MVGFFYIPTSKHLNNHYLKCNAFHEGDIRGLGFALLGSSHVMEEIMQINATFLGSVCFFNQDTNKIEWYHDYMQEIFDNCDSEEIRESGQHTMSLVEQGDLVEYKTTLWSSLSFEDRESALGLGTQSGVGTIEQTNFIFANEMQIKKLYQVLFDANTEQDLVSTNYVWYNGQLYHGLKEKNKPESLVYVPLVASVFLHLKSLASPFYLQGSYSNMEHYFNHHITSKDINTLMSLAHHNKKEKLFYVCPLLQPLIDKEDLEKTISPSPITAQTMKV